MREYDAQGLVNPSVRQMNLSPTGQTSNPLEAGYYPAIANQGRPTFTPEGSAITLPTGYYEGGSVQPVRMAYGSVTSSTAEDTFYLTDGSSTTAYYIDISLSSSSVTSLWALSAWQHVVGATGSGIYGSSLGYADGVTSNAVAYFLDGDTFESGGALSLSGNNIRIPVQEKGTSYAYQMVWS